MFLEKSNLSQKETSSQYTERSLIPSQGTLQTKFISLLLLPFTLPFKICRYFAMLPIKWADQLVEHGLKKLKMTKGDAQVYAKKVAKKQAKLMRNFCLILVLFVGVFSISLGISATAYTGAYLYLIPS
jgi:hypothetical protein